MLSAQHKRVQIFVLDPSNALVSLETSLEKRDYRVIRKTTPENLNAFLEANSIKRFVVLCSPSLSISAKSNLEGFSESKWSKHHSITSLSKRNIKNPKTLLANLDLLLKIHTPPLLFRVFKTRISVALATGFTTSVLGAAAYAQIQNSIFIKGPQATNHAVTSDGQVVPNTDNLLEIPIQNGSNNT